MSLVISISDGPRPQRTDNSTFLLRTELAAVGIETQAVTSDAPEGTKSGTALAIGSLVVQGALSAGALTAFAKVTVAFLQRGGDIRIKLVHGEDTLEIHGRHNRDDVRRMIEDFDARRPPTGDVG